MSSLSFSFKMCISCFVSPHYWFLCGNSNDSFVTAGSCVAAVRLPIVGSCVTTIRYPFFMLGQLGWNLKGMCMNDEVLELSGK